MSWSTPCFTQTLEMLSSSSPTTSSSSFSYLQPCSSIDNHSNSLLYNLSLLKDKFHQLDSLVTILVSPTNPSQPPPATAIANMGALVQDIIVTSSSMLLTSQHMTQTITNLSRNPHDMDRGFHSNADWLLNNVNINKELSASQGMVSSETRCDVVEIGVADLLAKYTHYCKICGKGFKRDANLRMHMRAHGDEYKSSAALVNPMKSSNVRVGGGVVESVQRKFSCPEEGCRWNKKHERFQPLKSMICVKNHYKRSHCPKMYVCKRCNSKQFSVLSDLKTHEKHCGDVKWLCSCGTTFTRKDKLVGHVALFAGHFPVTNIANNIEKCRV